MTIAEALLNLTRTFYLAIPPNMKEEFTTIDPELDNKTLAWVHAEQLCRICTSEPPITSPESTQYTFPDGSTYTLTAQEDES
jgi:hypothetical protein